MKNNYNKFIRAGNNNSESKSENKVRIYEVTSSPHNAYFPFSSDYEDESDTCDVRGVSSYQVETARDISYGKETRNELSGANMMKKVQFILHVDERH